MGQKIHPLGFRIGITEPHRSRWYAPKALFGELLIEDYKIRKFIDHRLNRTPPFAAVAEIGIERTREELTIIIKTARPGLVIGPKGVEVERLQNNIQAMTGRKVAIKIVEIKSPDTSAALIAEGIAEQLKKRAAFRRILKMRAEAAMSAGAKGCKISVAGRLGGSEMSRRVTVSLGSIPLQTLQAHVDYGYIPSVTKYGTIGVKVWVFKGMYESSTEGDEGSTAAGARARARGRR